jgi:Tol biopolymer transport system component
MGSQPIVRCLVLLLLPGLLAAQVIFSRRVYAEHGRTYRQIWIWTASDGTLKPLTHSPRDHSQPSCSRDGKRILFVSEPDGHRPGSVWSLDRATGAERELWSAPDPGCISVELAGIARDGAPLIEKESVAERSILSGLYKGGSHAFQFAGANEDSALSPDGLLLVRSAATEDPMDQPGAAYVTDTATGQSHVSIGKCGEPGWSPDGKRIACSSGFVTDGATGKLRMSIGRCELPRWSPDGARIACSSADDIFIVDAATLQEVERVPLPKLAGPHYPQELAWSPDARNMVFGVYGENAGSGRPESDFVVLNLAAKTWTRAGSGNTATWLPGGHAFVYITPRDLVPLPPSGEHHVWSAHLAMFDLTTRTQKLLTSGLTNNDDPVICGH